MPDSIRVQGQTTFRPGVFPLVDAEALAGLGPAITGTIAVLGEFVRGGPPQTPIIVRSASALRRLLTARDAAIIGQLAFRPSSDPRIPNGANRLILVRVNKADYAALTVQDDGDQDSIILKAADAGAFGNEIKVQVLASSRYAGAGRKVTVAYRSESAAVDNLGYNQQKVRLGYDGDIPEDDVYESCQVALDGAMFAIEWRLRTPKPTGPSKAWLPSGVAFTSAIVFETTDNAGTLAPPGAGNTVSIQVQGVNRETGKADTETVTISGASTRGVTTKQWSHVDAITISGNFGATATQLRISALSHLADTTTSELQHLVGRYTGAGDSYHALLLGTSTAPVSDLDQEGVYDPDSWPHVSGRELRTRMSVGEAGWGANGPVAAPFAWAGRLAFLLSGALGNDVSFAISGTARDTNEAASETVTIKAGSLYGAGSIAWASVTSIVKTGSLGTETVQISSDGIGLTANLKALVDGVNNALSTYITATRADGAKDLPAPMAVAQYLLGGSDNIPAAASDWTAALDLLKAPDLEIQHVVPLTGSAAVHAATRDHVDYMSGAYGGVARNAYLGFGSVPTRGELAERRALLNSRNVALLAQAISVFDENGEVLELPPYYTALLAAACDAGRAPGEGVTWRYVSIVDARDGASLSGADRWAVVDDLEDLIATGIFVIEKRPTGFRWSRDVTTYAVDNNPVFSSVTANESVNRSNESMRRALEAFIGKQVTGILPSQVRLRVREELARQVRDNEIKAFDPRSIEVEDLGNAMNVGYKVAVLETLYWITTTLHVVRMAA